MKKLFFSFLTAFFCNLTLFAQGLDFTASPTSGSAPLNVTFTNTSTNQNAYKYIWYFGDGNSVVDYNTTTISHIYTTSGTFTPQFDAYDTANVLINFTNGSSGNITVSSALSVTATSSNVYCNGAANGTATATPNGGVSPYSYSWFPGLQNTQNISSLSPGTYIVTVTDYTSSQASDTIVISEPPPLNLSLTTVNLTCNGLYNGSVTAIATGGTPTGGTPGYTYGWTPYVGVDSTVNNLQPGNYSVVITDANGCKDSANTTITEPTAISVSINGGSTICSGTNTNLTSVGSSGGTGAYTYLWTPGSLTSANITVSPASSTTYSLNITDANGCVALGTKTVGVNANASIALTSAAGTNTQSSCVNTAITSITYAITGGGTGAGVTGLPAGITGTFAGGVFTISGSAIAAGTYIYTVTTTGSCAQATATGIITINPSTGIYGHVSYSSGDVTSGKIIIYLQNGWQFDSVQVATLAANGIFNSSPLDPGNYLLKAFADTSYHTLISTYNGNVWDWNIATVIVHDCSMTDTANITMVEETLIAPGPGSIGGLIEEGSGFGRQEGDPIPGLDVKLGKNPGGQIVGTTQTDGNGYYFFANLALNSDIGGSYVIFADIPGIGMASSYEVVLNPSHSSYDSLNYVVDSTSIDTVPSSLATAINTSIQKENKFKVYPNPFKGNTSIEYTVSREADVKLEVVNVLGVKIKSLVNSKQLAGNYRCNLSNQNNQLSSDVYFITLSIDGKASTQRIVVME